MISQLYALLTAYNVIRESADDAQKAQIEVEERAILVLALKAAKKWLTEYLAPAA